MDSISPVYLLLAAVVCSCVGRALLIRAAWEISKPWGFAVLCVPLAPMFFRMNYKELAHEGQHWRTATTIFGVLFIAITGSSGSLNDLWSIVPEKFRPASSLIETVEPDEHDAPAIVVAATPAPPSYAERVAANQREFARLSEVYETLKRERGYLRKHDQEGIQAYNVRAAKYQADLVDARAEQTELIKLVAKK